MSNSKFENTFIYLIGFPGTGKYTIAQEILAKADFKLVDNHLINNPVFSLVNEEGWTHQRARIFENVFKIWDAVADTLIHISARHHNFVLTNYLRHGDEGDHRHYDRIKNIADQRQGHFVPVRLLLSDHDEHVKRITADGRKQKMKQTNRDAPHKYAQEQVLHVPHPHLLSLDVTRLAAAEAADIILKHAVSI